MKIDWSNYPIYPVIISGPLSELTRNEARMEFDHAMRIKDDRQQILADFTARNGIKLERSYDCILELNLWFRNNICSEPMFNNRLLSEWYSFGKDLNLYLGDWLLSLYPWLKWKLYTSSKNSPDYQSPVLTGYKISPKKHAAFDQMIAGWGLTYLKHPEESPSPIVRKFVHSQDIDEEERNSILISIFGQNSGSA